VRVEGKGVGPSSFHTQVNSPKRLDDAGEVQDAFDEAHGRDDRDEAEDDTVREAEANAHEPGVDDGAGDGEGEQGADDAEAAEEFEHDESFRIGESVSPEFRYHPLEE